MFLFVPSLSEASDEVLPRSVLLWEGPVRWAAAVMSVVMAVAATIWYVEERVVRSLIAMYEPSEAPGVKPRSFTSSVVVARDRASVWALLNDPELAVAMGQATSEFRVPGTPTGVGEQQCFVCRSGDRASASLVEVTEFVEGSLVRTKSLTRGGVSTYQLEDVPEGTRLTCTEHLLVKRRHWRQTQGLLRDHHEALFRTIRRLLE